MGQYILRPKAVQDLDEQAGYYAAEANSELGHRFLAAAHYTFTLLATQPSMGWRSRLKDPNLQSLRIFRVTGFTRILILYQPLRDGIEVFRVVHGSRNLRAFVRREGLE